MSLPNRLPSGRSSPQFGRSSLVATVGPALGALALLLAVAAAVVGAWRTWPRLHSSGGHVAAIRAAEAPAVHEGLPVGLFRRWRERLSPGDRWWLDVPHGATVGLTHRGEIYRTFAFYYFLPALPASSARQATVTFHVRSAR